MANHEMTELLEKALAAGAAQVPTAQNCGGVPYVMVPEGYKITSLGDMVYDPRIEANADFPKRKALTVVTTEPSSFLAYWALHQIEDSQAYAFPPAGKIDGCIDDHGGPEKQARWRRHWVNLQLKKSEEWDTWFGKNKKPMDQAAFAEFLEDNAPDIIEPNAATFIDCARDLKAKADVVFESKVNSQNGSANFAYKENVQGQFGQGNIEIPERFKISIQVYLGMPKVSIEGRLRYRVNGGKLSMWYDLYRLAWIERMAFESVLKTIEEGIGKKVFICS